MGISESDNSSASNTYFPSLPRSLLIVPTLESPPISNNKNKTPDQEYCQRRVCIMGALCNCFHVPDTNNSTTGDCSCPKWFVHKFFKKKSNTSAAMHPNQETVSLNPEAALNNLSDAGGSNEVRARQTKDSSRSRVEPTSEYQPVTETNIQENSKSVQVDEIVASKSEPEFQEPEPSVVTSSRGKSLDDDDVCPTCLEEYTLENPKIIAHCSHHYHLGCIYDWMERSEKCPAL